MATETTKLTFIEGAAASTPAASRGVVYFKADGLAYSKDDAGAETLMSSGSSGSVATDAIWDAAGDLVQGTGANTAAKLGAGLAGQLLRSAGAAAANTWAYPPGHEFNYVEVTSPVTVSATVEATPTDIVVGGAVTYDGSTVILIEFYAPNVRPSTTVQSIVFLYLYDGTTSLGYMALLRNDAADDQDVPVYIARRLTPSAASHTYKIGGIQSGGNGTVNVGAGGTGNAMPGFIRITKV